jgi:3-oxoacyl-[acyl-carrier-protein] synthase III
VRFLAIEHALPSRLVTNEDQINEALEKSRLHLSQDDLAALSLRLRKILRVTKTQYRYLRAPGETAHDLGVRAGRQALETAGLSPLDIDLLIYVGVGRGFLEPSTANVFQDSLGLSNSTCFDLLDACASWVRALDVARTFIQIGRYKRVMLMNCECNQEFGDLTFRSLDDVDFKFPQLTIGEAATATIISASDDDDDYYATFKSWGSHHNLCKIPLPHYRQFSNGNDIESLPSLNFYSYGEQLFRVVFKKVVAHYREDEKLHTFPNDITFGHSASDSMSERVTQVLNLKNMHLTHALFGNTVSASIPLGMSHALKQESLKSDMKVLLACGSAGVTTAWARFRFMN